jgi:U3 small nucleolar RNA-associated protein 11
MLKNIKKYIPKRKYRERSQFEKRKKKGFLEKKKDYKIRAEDYHRKEEKYKKLKEAARTRNPDEFYHRMLKAKIIDGEHIEFSDEKNLQDKIISNTQFINLVNFKKSQIENEKEKLKIDLQLKSNLFKGKKHKNILYYDNEDDVLKDEMLNKKREREEEEIKIDNDKLNKYKQKVKNVKQLEAISQGLQEQKELIKPAKRKKDKEGFYKYFIERKK